MRSSVFWKTMELRQVCQVHCMAHIINLGAQDIIVSLKVPAVHDGIDMDEDLENEVFEQIR